MIQKPITILIPSHGLEDFPTDCTEEEAAGLLNAFSATWHPALLHAAAHIPEWDRADLPLEELEGRTIVVPLVSIEHLPSGWRQRAKDNNATKKLQIVTNCSPNYLNSMQSQSLQPKSQ